jgi:UDP-glucose 4-epimerase
VQRVAVTGAGGRLGRLVMDLLAQQGIDAIGLDVTPAPRSVRADLGDLGAVFGVLARADGVIHLGAIPAPGGLPPERVFTNNTVGTFHVFEAARQLGISRVVSASSLSAYGYPFQRVWSEPHYFPLDEAHPLEPQDPYGLSKQVGEQIAAAYARSGAGTAVSLRFSHLVSDETLPGWQALMRDKPKTAASSLWSHVHDTDVARACVEALTAPLTGHTAVLLTARTTAADRPTAELLAEYFPSVPARPGPDPHWSLVDCSLAGKILGWDPR